MITILKKLGLDPYEIQIYDFLVKNGQSIPSHIATVLDIKRPTVYKTLYALEDKRLVERTELSENAEFRANDPKVLERIIQKKRKDVNKVMDDFLLEYPKYLEFFRQKSATPLIDIYYGVAGLKKVHLDIEKSAKEVLLIRSVFDRGSDELKQEIDRHVAKRGKLGIPTKIITPKVATTNNTLKEFPIVPNREIKFVDKDKLNMDTQIMIYNDKAAITNYRNELVTLVIHQENIVNSMRTLFYFCGELGPAA